MDSNHIEQATQALDTAVAEGKVGQQNQGHEQQAPETQEAPDLDKLGRFKFEGRELTPDQLRKERMLHSDYTKKTQALSEEKKYWANLDADIAKVQHDPSLAAQFKKLYPKDFHKFLTYAGYKESEAREETQSKGNQGIDPEIIQEFNQMKNYIREQEVAKHEAVLDTKFAKLSQKYPDGVEDVVLARAEALMNKQIELTDEVWEKLWKDSHESMVTRYRSGQKKLVDTQRAANQRGKAQGPGGGTPGAAPQRMKLKDVADFAIRDLTTKR